MKNNNKKTVIFKILDRVKNYKLALATSIVMAIVTVACQLYVPILIGRAIDLIVGPGNVDFTGIIKIIGQIGIFIAGVFLSQWIMNMCNNKITFGVTKDIRDEAFDKIETLPLKYIDANSYGDIVSRVIADVDTFADGLLMGFTQFFTGVLTIIGTLGFMFFIDFRITLLVFLLTPLSLVIAWFIAKKTFNSFKRQSETRGEQTALIDESINGVKVIKSFNSEAKYLKEFDEINERLADYSLKAVFFSSLTNPSTRFVNSLVYAVVAVSGGILAINGGISVGELVSFLSYANQYTKPFNEISGVITELQNSIACAARIFELIEEESEISDEGKYELSDISGKVDLENVYFSYTKDTQLITDFNLDVKPGQRIAIVGPTGCGKTTLINLLMRFYDVNEGSIKISGHDLRDITRESLRHGFGMVLQETWLKSGTIRDNIVMAKEDASEEEIIAACKEAYSWGFIKKLPKGLDTPIGEDGGSLSAGQKQLLCITRIMLANPPMLILDEATSSIDTRTELKIQDAFAKLMDGKTSFIVAHRLSTIKNADVILVMKDGNILEQGNHEELLKANGFYKKLYESQFIKASDEDEE